MIMNNDDNIINNLSDTDVQQDFQATIRNWINQRFSKNRPFSTRASTMIVDSRATSHFIQAEEKLPHTEISTKVVFLPNGEQIKHLTQQSCRFHHCHQKLVTPTSSLDFGNTLYSALENSLTPAIPLSSIRLEKASRELKWSLRKTNGRGRIGHHRRGWPMLFGQIKVELSLKEE